MRPTSFLAISAASFAFMAAVTPADRPNIPINWGDDIGHSKISAYPRGLPST